MIDKQKLISRLKNHKPSFEELRTILKVGETELKKALKQLEAEGIPLEVHSAKDRSKTLYHINVQPNIGNVYFISGQDNKEREMRFAATGDWHFASKFHLGRTWHEAMGRAEDAGIKKVFVAGDVIDGVCIYSGHLENLIAFGVEDQTDIAAHALSQHPNLEFWGIAGNHDYSHTKLNGVRPLDILAQKVDNFKNLGDLRADIVYHGIRVRLLHGAGGRAYAVSYPSQTYLRDLFKGMEREDLKNIPHIILLGHYHTLYQGKDHGIHIIQPGSFQDAENEYCVRRGLTGPNGLVLVHAGYKNGIIEKFATEFIQPRIIKEERGLIYKKKK